MDFDSQDEFESVPLPNQLPKSDHNYAAQFENTAKSRTVQTLLNQNQDLMARLTVSLKRNIELEQKVESCEDLYQKLSNQYDTLKDQVAIHQEKSKRMEYENQRIIDENISQEKRFGELYTAYQDKIGYIQKLSYQLHRYLKYRKRIRGYVRPFISSLKNSILNLKSQILELNEKNLKNSELILDLKEKLTQAVDHIQGITQQAEIDQSELVAYHEDRYQKIYNELQKTLDTKEALEVAEIEHKKQIENLKETEVALTNKSIFFERKYTDLKFEFEKVSDQLLKQHSSDAAQITQMDIQINDLSNQLATTTEIKATLEIENQTLNDQYQSMQILYQDSSQKIEDFRKKQTALEQVNKELSQALLENRKKAESLEEKLVLAEEEFKRKLQAFQVRFNRSSSENISVHSIQPQAVAQPNDQKELLNKIQNLLSEIQTGHTHLAQVDFKEDQHTSTDHLMSEYGEIEK